MSFVGSGGLGLSLSRRTYHFLHSLESFFPCLYFRQDCVPFFFFKFSKHMSLDHDLLILLVYLGVNDLVLDGVNGPVFYVVLGDVE